jgi:hypothetical protein
MSCVIWTTTACGAGGSAGTPGVVELQQHDQIAHAHRSTLHDGAVERHRAAELPDDPTEHARILNLRVRIVVPVRASGRPRGFGPPGSGWRIDPASSEPMAATEPPDCEGAPPDKPVSEQGQPGVLGTGGPEATRAWQERREPPLIPGQEHEGRPGEPARTCVHPPDSPLPLPAQPPGRPPSESPITGAPA